MTNILEIKNLKTYFYASSGVVKAVDGVSFDVAKGEIFGIVGESGSGKTLTGLSILKIVPYPGKITGGEILFKGSDLVNMGNECLRNIRGAKISMVFQEPATSLDPVFTIGSQMTEALLAHGRIEDAQGSKEVVIEYLKKVHISDPERIYRSYPHQLSGGTKQRIMIATALLNSPELLILDEPTTALDVTIQAQILDLLDEIIEKFKLSILFISHDFGVIRRMCDRVAVMRKGRIIETGNTDDILRNPAQPYTASLIESVKALS